MSKEIKAQNKEDLKIFDFKPDQPNRIFDQALMMKYYKLALLELRYKNLTMAAEFLNIAQVRFTTSGIIPSAALSVSRLRREIWFNVNFLIDVVGCCTEISPKDFQSTKDWKGDHMLGGINIFAVKRFAMLIGHELLHSLLGHTRDTYTSKMPNQNLANLVEDSYINHCLYSLKFDITLTEPYLKSPITSWMSPLGQPKSDDAIGVQLKNDLMQFPINTTVWDLYNYLMKEHGKDGNDCQEGESGSVYLGNHNSRSNQEGNKKEQKSEAKEGSGSEGESNNPVNDIGALGDSLREMNKALGSSKFGSMFEETLLIEPSKNDTLLKALKASEILKGMQGQIKQSIQTYKKGNIPYSSPRPDPKEFTKSDRAALLAGFPLKPFYRRFRGQEKTKAVVYLDVSGSIYYMVPALYSMLSYACDVFELDIFLFSTTLDPISLVDLKKGNCKSTGGTDFNVWVEHLRSQDKYKVALVITDGFDSLTSENMQWLIDSKTVLNYLIVDGGRLPDDMRTHANKVWDLKVR